MAGGGASGKIYIWEVSDWNLLASWPAHHKGVTCLVFSDDGSLLISGADDGNVSVWSLIRILDSRERLQAVKPVAPKKMFLYKWSGHRAPVSAVTVGAGSANAVVVSSSRDQTCKVWSLGMGKLLQSISFQSAVNSIVLHPSESSLYAGLSDGKVVVQSVNQVPPPFVSNENVNSFSFDLVAHRSPVTALAFSVAGNALVSGSEDSSICVWDVLTGNIVRELHTKGPITNILVVPESYAFGQYKDYEQTYCRNRTLFTMFSDSMRSPTIHGEPLVALPLSVPGNGEPAQGYSYSANSLENQLLELKHESTPASLQLKIDIMKEKSARALKTERDYFQQNELLSSVFLEIHHSPTEYGS